VPPGRFRLKENDQIFFLHIPKTGGMSLKQILKHRVGEDRFHQIPIHKFGEAHAQELASYRCIRAHWDYGFFRVLSRKPVYITMLRQPVSRMLSLYGMIQRKPDSRWYTEDIHRFIDAIGAQRLQVHFLAGTISGRPLAGEGLLEVALTRLEECACYGITEYFRLSADLLCATFGWPKISSLEIRNEAAPGEKPQVDREIVAHIEETCRMDLKLYQAALEPFLARTASAA
jgi:hypothetical protein